MSRKSAFRALSVLLAVFAATLTVSLAASAQIPRPIGKTVLEGMAMDDNGEPLYKQSLEIIISDSAGEVVHTYGFEAGLGGLYHYEPKAGVYSIFIKPGGNTIGRLRPLRLNGVLVRAGKVNKLNITMHSGSALEEIGAPIEPTLPAIIISEKLDSLQKQVDVLKAQVAALKTK